ncbi:hypothetical protein RJT34_11885 [Clitoria ternatea]|uniref:Membrane protein of ER body-like protein n=1 Tax=Clitoria ternatea TaxID=43366 RepID=A0AAN9JKS4_CLITE
MEQEHLHGIVHDHEEEMDDGALKTRKSVLHGKENLIKDTEPSPSSLTSNGSELSNGTCSVVTDPDGSPVQKEVQVEEIVNVVENNNHVNGDKVDYEAVGLGHVAEFVGAETNGDAIPGFTFGAAVSQNNNSVYFDEPQEGEVNGLNGVQKGDAAWSVHPTNAEGRIDTRVDHSVIQNSLCRKIDNQCIKTADDKVHSSSELSHLHSSSNIQATAITNFHKEASTKEGSDLIKEVDQQLEEFDVEAVLAKQETHDLFCPNCKAHITKRVILKKRKRSIHKLENEAKRDKLETKVSTELIDNSVQPEANQGDHANVTSDIVSLESPANNDHPDTEPELFRCLSCFSFFIPSGKCFDVFRNFGGASKNESSQNPPSIPASNIQSTSSPSGSNANWLLSLITSKKGEKTSDASLERSRSGPAEQHHSTPTTSDVLTSPEIGHPEGALTDTSAIKNVKPLPDTNHGHGGLNSLTSSTNDLSSTQSCTKSAGDLLNGVQKVGQEYFIEVSTKEQLLDGIGNPITHGEKKNSSADIIKTNNVEITPSMNFSDEKVPKYESAQLADAATSKTLANDGETTKDATLNPIEGEREQLPNQLIGDEVSASHGVGSSKQNFGIDANAIVPSKISITVINKVTKDSDREITHSTRKENEGGDVIVEVEREAIGFTTSQAIGNIPNEGEIVTEPRTQAHHEPLRDEVGEPQGWEILKSIVYGGLMESIASLGIVSSAVSSGATPLNIIALGFANIIGGLFILGNNLIDLKSDHSGGNQQQMNLQDRYQELLGRRANFLLHIVVAVISFLIFGSVPLAVYGILINKNYYAEVKLAAVATTSVVCIILLAIGKVYTSRPPKSYIKTVLYFVTLALAASGVSYIVGNLIKDLLEKLNHSESGFVITMPISDTSMQPAWTSY